MKKTHAHHLLLHRWLLAGILLACLASGAVLSAETVNQRYKAPDNTFSFIPPAGWEQKDWPGMKYKIFVTQPAEKFAPNISVVDEASNLPLKDYVDANRKALAGASKNFKELSVSPFAAEGNLQGYRLTFKNRYEEIDVIQAQYYFGTQENKFVITCSIAEKDSRPIIAQCDQSLKTFQLRTH